LQSSNSNQTAQTGLFGHNYTYNASMTPHNVPEAQFGENTERQDDNL